MQGGDALSSPWAKNSRRILRGQSTIQVLISSEISPWIERDIWIIKVATHISVVFDQTVLGQERIVRRCAIEMNIHTDQFPNERFGFTPKSHGKSALMAAAINTAFFDCGWVLLIQPVGEAGLRGD
ncbi:hypothetical protein AL062_22250 [Pseudomonas syringae pv. syringae]|nr:hypothetical protein AL062_22250 [Pseudomonas syringae pv. syringae]